MHRILIVLTSMMWAMPAHAYLDPGTGSFLLQLLLGGIAGFVVIVKLYWHILLEKFEKFRFWKKKEETDRSEHD